MILFISSSQQLTTIVEGSIHRPHRYSKSSILSSSEQRRGRSKHRNHFRYSRKETIAIIDAALLQTRGGAKKATSSTTEEENLAAIIANVSPNVKENVGEEINAAKDNQDINTSISESEGDVEDAVPEKDAVEDSTEVDSSVSSLASSLGEETEEEPSDTNNALLDCDKPVSEILEEAAALRQRGKERHEEGKFAEAAIQFHQAANLLEACLDKEDMEENNEVDAEEVNRDDNPDENTSPSEASSVNLQDEWATCRLHESLCHLKAEDYQKCVEACSSLLESAPENHTPAAMIRARAHHRRARALVALGDTDEALADARSAAFLGERKAVTFYGKLLRDTGGSSSANENSFLSSSSPMGGLMDPSSSKLLESLLSKSSPHSDDGAGSDFMSSSFLSSMAGSFLSPGGLGGAKGSGGGGMAKSIINSLSKKLEDESTHEGICQYLQSTNPMAIQSMASMAGIELSSGHANALVRIAHGITPKTIRRTVKTTKRAIWGFQLIRKTMAVLSKYRNLLFLLMLLQWTKSSLLRPAPMPKIKAAKAPKIPKKVAKTNANQNANNNNPNVNGQAKNRKPKTPGLLNPLGAAAQR